MFVPSKHNSRYFQAFQVFNVKKKNQQNPKQQQLISKIYGN